jgi:hypothetical protein
VFWYKAEMHGEFQIGAPEFWKHSMEHYKEKGEDQGNEYDATANRRLKGPLINVKKF